MKETNPTAVRRLVTPGRLGTRNINLYFAREESLSHDKATLDPLIFDL